MMLRRLGVFERALFLSDRHSPFNVVCVLRLQNPPAPDLLQRAWGILQLRQPLLTAVIRSGNFETGEAPPPPEVVTGLAEDGWLAAVEREMNTRLDPERALSRGTYIVGRERADLVLTFHHAIMDAASGMHLLDDLLRLCADLQSGERTSGPALPQVLPPVEARFPPAFRGLSGSLKLAAYAMAQMGEEVSYRARTVGKRTAAVHPGGHGFPLTTLVPESLVDALSKRCRARQLTLNSLLNASIVLAVDRMLYQGAARPLQTFTFADLRPYTVPPTPEEDLANYISMLRLTVDVSAQADIWSLAAQLHDKIYRSLKQGDKFSAARMSEPLMKMFVGLKSTRMGAAGLNYSGAVPLKGQYGAIRLTGVHAFLSSSDLGPEVSCQARLFRDELWMDFMFLEMDMDRATAGRVVAEVRSILEQAASAPG